MLDIPLSVPLLLPLAGGLAAALLPLRFGRWATVAAAAGVLAYAVVMLADFDRDAGAHYATEVDWIPELGIHYALAIDGLNLFLVALTAVLWLPATIWAAFTERERPRLFLFQLALAETAVLGVFLAQDLALFVFFFDLMLVPFYFLMGAWGEGERRVAATTKFVIYTLVGSLLMLAGAVALGVLSTPEGGELSFLFDDLEGRSVGAGTQRWIFLMFAAAFLIKAPAFPLHGWMPDAYRATPMPVLVVFAALLSKVAVYGFLRIVLPILPDASSWFQDPMLIVALVSILYGSVLAFSQDDVRLVVGYSSIAQLGFIVLGIFALDAKGAQGATMQMVNHGLVVGALFFVLWGVRRAADGSWSLSEMGGVAFRAPVLAALLLIVALASLAMPGSPNFVGELLILFGTFEDKLVYGLVASVGIALAAVYMIRLYQRAIHNPVGEKVVSRDACRLDLATAPALVVAIVALGVYPQFFLDRSEPAATATIKAAVEAAEGRDEPAAPAAEDEVPPGQFQPVEPPPGAPPGTEGAPPGVPPGVPPGAGPPTGPPPGAGPPTGPPPGVPPGAEGGPPPQPGEVPQQEVPLP